MRRDNHVPVFLRSCKGSTERAPAAHAVDGRQDSGWRFEPGDRKPWIEIELKRPIRANTVVLSQLNPRPIHRNHFDRITRVSLQVNRGRDPVVVDMEPDELKPTEVDLGKEFRIRSLRIEVLDRETGGVHRGVGGFAEIGVVKAPGR